MSSYDQGRMDAWERIDALKRRLGLLGFFNEQKHKRYPKGHPKAGEFMPKPKEGKKPVPAKKIFNLNLSPIETEIDGNKFSLVFRNAGSGIAIDFFANEQYDVQDLPEKTRRKAALWWRRSAVNAARMMPDGVPLRAAAYMEDGNGRARLDFYKALGFHGDSYGVFATTKGGKIVPETEVESLARRKVEVREMKGGKPKRPYSPQDYDRDLDTVFNRASSAVPPGQIPYNFAEYGSTNSSRSEYSTPEWLMVNTEERGSESMSNYIPPTPDDNRLFEALSAGIPNTQPSQTNTRKKK